MAQDAPSPFHFQLRARSAERMAPSDRSSRKNRRNRRNRLFSSQLKAHSSQEILQVVNGER